MIAIQRIVPLRLIHKQLILMTDNIKNVSNVLK